MNQPTGLCQNYYLVEELLQFYRPFETWHYSKHENGSVKTKTISWSTHTSKVIFLHCWICLGPKRKWKGFCPEIIKHRVGELSYVVYVEEKEVWRHTDHLRSKFDKQVEVERISNTSVNFRYSHSRSSLTNLSQCSNKTGFARGKPKCWW